MATRISNPQVYMYVAGLLSFTISTTPLKECGDLVQEGDHYKIKQGESDCNMYICFL